MSSPNNTQLNIPQVHEATDRFKIHAAQKVSVNLTNGYTGHLAYREAGSVGWQTGAKMFSVRTAKYERNN